MNEVLFFIVCVLIPFLFLATLLIYCTYKVFDEKEDKENKMTKRICTKHTNIILFEEIGFAIIYQSHWSFYFLIGFIGIEISISSFKRQ